MRRLSKSFYLGSIVLAGGIVFAYLAVVRLQPAGDMAQSIAFLVVNLIATLYFGVVSMTLMYKAWASIQDGYARTTPGKAIGFALIPIFNLYWMFQLIWGYAKDYNAYARRHQIQAKRLPEGLFLAHSVVVLGGIIPMIGPLFGLLAFVIWMFEVHLLCDAVNTISGAERVEAAEYQRPEYREGQSPAAQYQGLRTIIGAALVLVIAFCAISISQNVGKRLKVDVTGEKLYTLSRGTRAILSKLRQPVRAKLYYAKTASLKGPDQIKYFNNYYEFVKALLEEYAAISKGMVELELIDPRPFSDEEAEALRYGLRRFQITEEENFFFGLVVQTEFGVEKSIPFFSPDREKFVEYDISYLIDTAVTRQKRKIGIMSSLPVMGDDVSGYMAEMMRRQGQQPQPPWTFVEQLRSRYEVEQVAADVNEIEDIDILLVIHPKNLPEETLFAIDQFVLKGGRAIVCVDPHCIVDRPNQMEMQMGMQLSRGSDLNVLLRTWGLEMPANTFAGDKNILAWPARITGNMRSEKILGYLNLVPAGECFNSENVATAQLNQVEVLFAGVLKELADPNQAEQSDSQIERTPLMMTTDMGNSFSVSNPYELMMADQLMRKFIEGDKPVVMGYLVTGRFKSSFPEGIEIEVEQQSTEDPNETETIKKRIEGLTEAQEDCAVAVFSDVDFISDLLAYQNSFFGPMVYGDNSALMLNLIDVLGGSSDLVSIRSRGNYKRSFVVVDEIIKKAEAETAEEVTKLNAQITNFTNELQSIFATAQKGQEEVIGSSILQKQRDIELKKREAQRQLNEVKLKKRERIEHLGNLLRNFNMLMAPVVILVIAIVLGIRRSVRKRHYISHASDA